MPEEEEVARKLHRIKRRDEDGGQTLGWMIFCPGCRQYHAIYTEERNDCGAQWSFNGDVDHPTFSPSLKVTWTYGEQHEQHCCHSFIRDGNIEFLGDCTHELAGQIVPLPEWI